MRRNCTPSFAVLIASVACHPGSMSGDSAQSAESCRAGQGHLIELLDELPHRGLAVRGRSDLPTASLGSVVGGGHVIDVAKDAWLLDGEAIAGTNADERLAALRERLSQPLPPPETAGVPPTLLYLAVGGDTDARTLRGYLSAIPRRFAVYLLFQAPPPPGTTRSDSVSSVAERLRSESDPTKRSLVSRAAFGEWAHCKAALDAVDSVGAGDPTERWPKLQQALLQALPKCDCKDLDAPRLGEVLMAEQRAGAAAVGAVPFDFLRDERCGATFGLTPVQAIVKDIETFDAEFAGGYGAQSLDFQQVVTNDRLLQYLCQALPGETLASLQRERHTFFWKVRGTHSCQAWRFEPLAPGSPMGTWRRTNNQSEPLAVHYWQGAEDIRLFGPITDAASKPTDERTWPCDQEFHMRAVTADSIELDSGRWFFDAGACESAKDDGGAFPGCIAALAGGPTDPNNPGPVTFPTMSDLPEPEPER
jgi:hypothetical protein